MNTSISYLHFEELVMFRRISTSLSYLLVSISLASCSGATDSINALAESINNANNTTLESNNVTNTNAVVIEPVVTEPVVTEPVVAAPINAACSALYSNTFALVSGLDQSPIANLSKPVKGVSALDPTYGTCLTRVTDAANEEPSGFARNDYSRRQAFNADETFILIYAQDGYWHLYDAANLSYIRKLSLGGGSVEPQWHPTDPNLLFKLPNNGGLSIETHNVLTDEVVTVADFTNVASINGYPGVTSIKDIWPNVARVSTKNEGSPSKDARYWGLQVENSSFTASYGAITYDLQTNTITGVFDFAANGIGGPDHISMSPSGEYVVPSWNAEKCAGPSSLGTTNNPCGLMAYTRDFSTAVGLSEIGPHSDTAIDANGNDVIVISNYQSGFVESIELGTGQITRLFNIYVNDSATAMHISGKAFNKPGWVLISTYAATRTEEWWTKKIMAVEIAANPQILNISHTYSNEVGYWTQPQAAVNRDFTKIMFNSNWGSNSEDTDAYMIELPTTVLD